MHGVVESMRHAPQPRLRQLVPVRLHGLAGVVPQLSRYSLVSVAALALDFGVYLALTALAMSPPLAGVVGYVAGMLLHFALSARFVFDAVATGKVPARLFGEFALSGVAGIGITATVIALATEIAHLAPLPAKALAVAASFLAVFAIRRSLVFTALRPALPPLPADIYLKLTVAGAVFFFVIEFAYFVFSSPISFWKPSLDAFGGTAIGRDFLNVWMGGRSTFGAGPAVWFDFRVYNQYLLDFIGVSQMHSYVWSYPPHVVLLVWPFGLLPYLPAFVLWSVLGFAIFLYAAYSAGVDRKHLMLVALAPAVAINAFIGQNGFFLGALLIFGLAHLDRRPVLCGVLFGILTVKPQLGLVLPIVLVLTGRWLTIAAAVATASALIGATAWLYGPEVWTEYLAKVVPQQKFLQEHGQGLLFLQVPSAFYSGRLVGLPLNLAWGLQAVVSAAAAAAVAWTFWRRRDHVLSTALLVIAIFLASPYTLNYDFVVLGWVLALLLQRDDNELIDHYLIIAAWTLPATMMLAALVCVPLALLLLVGFAARLIWRLKEGGTVRGPHLLAPATG